MTKRMKVTVMSALTIVGALGSLKFMQIRAAIAQASSFNRRRRRSPRSSRSAPNGRRR